MNHSTTIPVGNAGAVLRLLLGACATLPEVTFTTEYPDSLGKRPNADLLDALRQLGVVVAAREPGGVLPITLQGIGLHGGHVTISGERSSQYLSALLFLAPLVREPVTIEVVGGLTSAGFVRLTLDILRQAGITMEASADLLHYDVPAPQTYQPREWHLPHDFPTAALWLSAAAIAGETITLVGLDPDAEDGQAIRSVARALGITMRETPAATAEQIDLVTSGSAALHGVTVDGGPIIDSVPAFAAAACFAEGTTMFTNVATLRLKESNRIDDLCAELNRVGAEAIAGDDTITIVGHPEGIAGGATVDAHHDHRLAMALALVALRAHAPITITGAQHVAKSYPAFWDEFARLGAQIETATE